jgi:predicted nucleic acid-binding protein
MNGKPSITAILDANILYPAPLRDFLLQLANLKLYQPKWTEQIQEEWIRNLLLKRLDLKRTSLEKTSDAMNAAFPEANIFDYEEIMKKLSLPDKNDKHVLAAAIETKANVIVTFNLKDFPSTYLKSYAIEALHPDDFISDLIKIDKTVCLTALNNQVLSLKNPPKSKEEVLNSLIKCGLNNSVNNLKK